MLDPEKYQVKMDKEPCRKQTGLEELSRRIEDLAAALDKATFTYRQMNDVLVGEEDTAETNKLAKETRRGAIGEIIDRLDRFEGIVHEVEYQNSRLRQVVPLD